MAKRRPAFDSLEPRLVMAAPVFQTSFQLPLAGNWTSTAYRSSPIFADIFGTGQDDLIAVTAGAQLVAYGVGPGGSATPLVVYQVPGAIADIKSTPIVVTDPRTGQKDLFAAMGRDEGTGKLEDGRLFGWNLRTGQLLPGWTAGQSTGINVNGQAGVYGSLTSGALEGNGLPDIVATSFSTYVTAFRLDGSTLWSWTSDDTIVSGAVIGDIDRTGVPSVVVGGDSSSSPFYQAGGWVNVLSNTGALKWRRQIPGEVTWSSPVLGDLNNNGYLDIVIGTGLNYDVFGGAGPGARAAGNNIYALDPFGNILPGWPYHTTSNDAQAHQVLAAPAIADLTGTGQLDVVAVDRSGVVHAVQPNGQPLPAFVGGRSIAPEFPPGTLPDDFGSVIVADVNGDGRPEIIAPYGQFLKGIDANGIVTNIATTNVVPPSVSPEWIDAAAAIGHFDGGPNYTLAVVSYNFALQGRPDQVQIFTLPASNLAPPWPMLRRTASGDAATRSPTFDHSYLADAFIAAIGHLPDPVTQANFNSALDSDAINLLQAAQLVNQSLPARQVEVQRAFQKFFGFYADASALNAWTTFLATNTRQNMEIFLASSPSFAQRASNNPVYEVYYLYQAILDRAPSVAELDYWYSTKLPPATLASIFLNVPEAINNHLAAYYAQVFGPGGQNLIPADAAAAYALDLHHGAREEDLDAGILATSGQYGSIDFLDNYVRDLYREILRRQPAPAEVAAWLQAYDAGTVAPSSTAFQLLNGQEARVDFVQQEFFALLGRLASNADAASLAGYTSRENLILAIVGSPEYFNRNGGTQSSYVTAIYRDLGGLNPVSQSTVNDWLKQFAAGMPLIAVAKGVISGVLYFNQNSVAEIFAYLPDESLGVLRIGNLPPTAPGQPINPSPALINYMVGQAQQGVSDEQLIATLLNTPDYYRRVTFYKGILRSPGIRI